MGRLSSILLAIGLLTGLAGTAGAGTPEYEAAKKAAIADSYGFAIKNSRPAVAALNRLWSILAEQALAAMRANPKAPKAVATALTAFDPNAWGEIVPMRGGLSLLSLRAGEIGTVFLIAGIGPDARIVWTPSQVDAAAVRKFPLLAAWRTENARTDCSRRAPYGAGGTCGPVDAIAGSLPADSQGRARFYLDATYAQGAGMGVSAQMSVWQWNGKTAEPLLLVPYDYMIEDTATRLDGNILRFRQKDEYKTAYVNAPDVGKQMDWRIRIDPDGVHNLGASPVGVEYALADNALWAALKRQPTDGLMSAPVAGKLRDLLAALPADDRKKDFAPLGELLTRTLYRSGDRTVVCWATEGLDEVLLFDLVGRGVGLRLIGVRAIPSRERPCPPKIPFLPDK